MKESSHSESQIEDEYDFADFKNNDIACDKCGASMGTCNEQIIVAFLCDNCADELELQYKKRHPEEYD